MSVFLLAGHACPTLAGAIEDAVAKGAVRFEPAAVPPILVGRLDGATAVHLAVGPGGALYAATGSTGKAHVWLLRNNAVVGEVIASGSREHMLVDWPASFSLWLGGLPVVAMSWKFSGTSYGIEDVAFWSVEGAGRFLGGLPGSTRSACSAGATALDASCARCPAASGIPIDLSLTSLAPDRARFIQKRAATWYYYFSAAAEVFEQDFMLTASGLVPDGSPRRTRAMMPLPQAQERVKALLHDYFQLAKTQSRQSIAPEFLTCFDQLVDLAPDFGQAHYNVGCMQALLGNEKQAVASVTKAIVLDPKYRNVARRDPDLSNVRRDPELARVLAGGGK